MSENLTRHLLADSLKEISRKKQLSSISVTELCRHCGVNRKSFYYHFLDKYDLVNWIFRTESELYFRSHTASSPFERLYYLLEYFFDNRTFYRRVLAVHGQNSFSEYLRQRIHSTLRELTAGTRKDGSPEFYADFYADAIVCSIIRWLLGSNPIPPESFFTYITGCLNGSAVISASADSSVVLPSHSHSAS